MGEYRQLYLASFAGEGVEEATELELMGLTNEAEDQRDEPTRRSA